MIALPFSYWMIEPRPSSLITHDCVAIKPSVVSAFRVRLSCPSKTALDCVLPSFKLNTRTSTSLLFALINPRLLFGS